MSGQAGTAVVGTAAKAAAAGAVLLLVIPLLVIMALTGSGDMDDCAAGAATPGAYGMGVNGVGGAHLAGMNAQQLTIARNTAAVGRQRHEPDSVIMANLLAEATESTFRNLANSTVPESLNFPHDGVGHDNDSVGPNQLRASVWGSVGMAKLMDPTYQANWFYDQADKIPGSKTMDPAALAQAVEVSGPNAYAGQTSLAQAVFAAVMPTVGDGTSVDVIGSVGDTPAAACTPGAGSGLTAIGGSAAQQAVVNAALKYVGMRYSWGGGDLNGPTLGIHDGGVADSYGDYAHVGLDCSGLVRLAYWQGAHIDITRTSDSQLSATSKWKVGSNVPTEQMQPGDLIFYGPGGRQHVQMYIGGGKLVEAPESGKTVRVKDYSPNAGQVAVTRPLAGMPAAQANVANQAAGQ